MRIGIFRSSADFALEQDPGEFEDLGRSEAHAGIRAEMAARLFAWLRARKRFPTIGHEDIAQWNRREVKAGIQIGRW